VVKVARNYRQAKAAASSGSGRQAHTKPVVAAAAVKPAVEESASNKPEAPVEPSAAPLQYYYDAEGRLNLRTVK
jgi:YD repeat-containing protein